VLTSVEYPSTQALLADHYESLGCEVCFIIQYTSEGVQFIRGFGSLGAILKYDWTYYPPEIESDVTSKPDHLDSVLLDSGYDRNFDTGNADHKNNTQNTTNNNDMLELEDFFM